MYSDCVNDRGVWCRARWQRESRSGACGRDVDELNVVGTGGGLEVVRRRAVGSERTGARLLGATAGETDVDRGPAVDAGRLTRSTTRRHRLVRLADKTLAVVPASDRHRFLLHARFWNSKWTFRRAGHLLCPAPYAGALRYNVSDDRRLSCASGLSREQRGLGRLKLAQR